MIWLVPGATTILASRVRCVGGFTQNFATGVVHIFSIRCVHWWFQTGFAVASHSTTQVVRRVHPRLHLFGHVHERNGATFRSGTLFVNSAMDMRPTVHVIDVQVTRRDKLTQSRPRRAPDDVFASTSLSQPSRGGS